MRMQKNEFAPDARPSVRVGDSPRTVIRPAGARVGAGEEKMQAGARIENAGSSSSSLVAASSKLVRARNINS